jgi:hypothetical protein
MPKTVYFKAKLLVERVPSCMSVIAFRCAKESTDAYNMATGSREPMNVVPRSSGETRFETHMDLWFHHGREQE